MLQYGRREREDHGVVSGSCKRVFAVQGDVLSIYDVNHEVR